MDMVSISLTDNGGICAFGLPLWEGVTTCLTYSLQTNLSGDVIFSAFLLIANISTDIRLSVPLLLGGAKRQEYRFGVAIGVSMTE